MISTVLTLCIMLFLAENALSTSMPTPWVNISCTNPCYSQALNDSTRWNNVAASQAWSAAVDDWQVRELNGSAFHFSQSIANFFGSPTDIECGDINLEGTCNQYTNCVSPAAYDAILRSFTYLHDYYANFLNDISLALGFVQSNAALFSLTFDLQIDQVPSSDIDITEIIIVSVSITIGLFFNEFVALFLDIAKTIKDVVNPIAVGSIVLASENTKNAIRRAILNNKREKVANIKDSGDEQAAFATLDAYLGVILKSLYNATAVTLSTLFDGSGVSTSQLQAIISDGSIMSAQGPNGSDWVTNIENIMFGYLAPVAWALSNQDLCPVILDYSADYGAGCPDVTYFDDFQSAKICHNNRTYFLLNANGESYDSSRVLALLPGTEDLVAGTFGITLANVVNGAVNGYVANGNQNNWQYPDATDPSVVDSFMNDLGVEQPGLIRVPVCPASLLSPCCASL